ncbi:sodium:solute symporter family protein [Methanimicrococcus blatticola]|uniref:SSS family solute:Na+ symporter n=1 Tax=Methanimicrococcus blatticola TaxID=91560 RepID=A0A484F411_9EURY|nr:sodium:solute symporter family protein [Methanimicrococcus blatticola]MBZ3936417.1 sodium:solute symporter family protein [Methanimicrococcus blatticola]MCC2509579.1 sodium:solute symporter family protein [Methanimicrococcus blatticola]TDQ67628.1 SSS family solute:Na+ symporter [Methanimicrococcus blatticola]
MNMLAMFGICLAIYIFVLLAIGWYYSKKQKSVVDFWLAGRKIGYIPIGFSAAASWITGGGILAVTASYLLGGLGSIWTFAAPNVIALFVIGLLVSKIKSLPAITQPELLEQRYAGSIRLPVAIIVAIVMMFFAAADVSGLMLIFNVFFGLDPIYAAILIAVAVSAYVLLGGLSAVVWTDVIQYILLATVTIFLTIAVLFTASDVSALSIGDFVSTSQSGTGWWNPFSIGLPLVIIFCVAIIPGWISEHDQWQKVWAAKDEKNARNGFFLGSLLIFLIFGVACCLLGLGLRYLFPEISNMGEAEIALLSYTLNNFSTVGVIAIALGLTAAAMSCMDTFATSGGSTISRDIYQRYIKPDATMKELKIVNRVAVLIIIIGATLIAFTNINIIEYIHIATYIASAAYFFPLMVGLYWKRATKEGAIASLVVGAVAQIGMVLIDLMMGTNADGVYYLEALSMDLTGYAILTCHGVIISMALSALALIVVSLRTKRSSVYNLAPFFEDEAKTLERDEVSGVNKASTDYSGYRDVLQAEVNGEREHLQLDLKASTPLNWDRFITDLRAKNEAWFTSSGNNSVYRLTHADLLSCPMISRGNNEQEIWIAAEPRVESTEVAQVEIYLAYKEIMETLQSMGILTDFIKPEEKKAI